jgi:hypothetical protein
MCWVLGVNKMIFFFEFWRAFFPSLCGWRWRVNQLQLSGLAVHAFENKIQKENATHNTRLSISLHFDRSLTESGFWAPNSGRYRRRV